MVIADSSGQILEKYAGSGHDQSSWQGAGLTTQAQSYNPRKWQTDDTWGGIQQFRNRAYDPATGTWIQEDPIGVAGGVNVYRFNNGNPVSFGDPFGLCPFCGAALLAGGVVGGIRLAANVLNGRPTFENVGRDAIVAGAAVLTLGAASAGGTATAVAGATVGRGALSSLGRAGAGRGVREVVGNANDARKLFDQLRGSNPVTEVKPGVFTAPGANGGTATFRAVSKSGPPTVDVNGIEEGVRKIKFVRQ